MVATLDVFSGTVTGSHFKLGSERCREEGSGGESDG